MITKAELLQGRDKLFASDYTQQISDNLDVLLEKLNVIRAAYGQPISVSSGWRPLAVNQSTANASKNSNHLTGLAADLKDMDGRLWDWCLQNLDLLTASGLYLEDKRWTSTWVHMQCVAPSSKKRIFIPQKGLPPFPQLFNGKYDSRYDK